MSTPNGNITLTTSDIAQLANVGRSTVSNWRNRHDDFPSPVSGSAASPRFAAVAVRAWLKSHGKKIEDLSSDRILWSAMDKWRGAAPLEEVGMFASALIVWRHVSDPESPGFDEALPPESWWPRLSETVRPGETYERISRGMRSFEASKRGGHKPVFGDFSQGGLFEESGKRHDLLMHFITTVDSFEADSLGEVFISFQDRLTNSMRRGYDESSTSSTLVDLMTAVSKAIPGPVHDPAAGSGRLLLAVGDHGENRTTLTGQDISLSACTQANQRAVVTGHDNVDIRLGDVFQTDYFAQGLAQVVVVDPPYGIRHHDDARLSLDPRLPYGSPSKSNMDTAWLQLALWYLGSQGRAFILQPHGAAFRGGADSKVRASLLRSGTVEAVVALPAGLASHTAILLDMWVLASPGESADPERVLLIDHSGTKDIDIDTIAGSLQDWREHRIVPTELPAGAFNVNDILAEGSDLTPQRWISYTADAPTVDSVRSHIDSLQRAIDKLKPLESLSSGSVTGGKQAPRLVSVADLVKTGTVTTVRANERVSDSDYDTEGTPVVSGQWIRNDEGEPRRINLSVLTREPVITRPGDVLVQNTGGLAARVDREGGQVLLSPSFHLLRLHEDVVRPEYLAEFLVNSTNQRQALGTGILRIRLQDMKIPLLPLAEQDRLVKRIEETRQLQAAASQILKAADATRNELVNAISAGTIQIH